MNRVLLLTLASLFLAPGVLAIDYTENFDTDPTGGLPSEAWYTLTPTGSLFVSANAPTIGVKSLSLGDGGLAQFTPAQAGLWDLCTGDLKVAFRYDEMPNAVGFSELIQIRDGAAGDAWSLLVSDTGVFQARVVSTTSDFGIVGLVVNEWYNATLSMSNCGTQQFSVFLSGNGLEEAISVDAPGATGSLDRFKLLVSGANFASTVRAKWDLVSLVSMNDPPPTAVGSSATVAVTDLVGFDVDPTGAGLIARVDGGDTIKSFAPTTLTELGTREVDCDGVGNQNNDMVASSDFANLYVVCDAGTNNPAFFSIRSFNEGTVTMPNCSASDCLDDIDLRGSGECTGSDDFPDDLELQEINDVASVPLDYSFRTGSGPLSSYALAVAYSADNGNVGVVQYTAVNNGDDRCQTVSAAFAGTAPEQFSVWRPDADSDNVYLAAVDDGGSNRFYVYTPAFTAGLFDGSMTSGAPLGDTTGGVAVSCDDDYCLVVTTAAASNVRLVNVKTGLTIWSTTSVTEVVRGAALAIRGGLTGANDFAVYLDGSTAYLVYANNGTAFGSLTLPAGTFKEVRLKDGSGQAWIATSSVIAYYDLLAAFPDVIPTGCENPPCDEEGDVGGSSGLFAPGADALVEGGTFANIGLANMFMGVLMVAGMTVTIGAAPQIVTGNRAEFNARLFMVLGVIGAILGFVLAISFGLFSTAVWVSMVVLAAIAIGVKVWLSRANGG